MTLKKAEVITRRCETVGCMFSHRAIARSEWLTADSGAMRKTAGACDALRRSLTSSASTRKFQSNRYSPSVTRPISIGKTASSASTPERCAGANLALKPDGAAGSSDRARTKPLSMKHRAVFGFIGAQPGKTPIKAGTSSK